MKSIRPYVPTLATFGSVFGPRHEIFDVFLILHIKLINQPMGKTSWVTAVWFDYRFTIQVRSLDVPGFISKIEYIL